MTNSTIIDALNTTIDPVLDKIIMDMADLEHGFGSYDKAVEWAAKKCTYEQAMTLSKAYQKLAQAMQDVATATVVSRMFVPAEDTPSSN